MVLRLYFKACVFKDVLLYQRNFYEWMVKKGILKNAEAQHSSGWLFFEHRPIAAESREMYCTWMSD